MHEKTITRRDFLKTSALLAATPFWATDLDQPMPADYLSPVAIKSPLEWTTPADFADTDPAVLALNRIAFGPRPGDLDKVKAMGVDAYIEQQLAPDAIDDSAVDNMLTAFPSLTMSIPDLLQNYAVPFMNGGSSNNGVNVGSAVRGFLGLLEGQSQTNVMPMPADSRMQSVLELVQATVLRQVYSERQLFELMVDFWSNHFNIYILKNQCRVLKTWDDREVIRKNALGKFRDLLFASATSPAMLIFLDNVTNLKAVPQENYARELMELHTLGVDGGYTQDDVENVAKAFTGWSVMAPRRSLFGMDYDNAGAFFFRKFQHDNTAKTILGTTIPPGGWMQDGEQVLDMLASSPKTAAHISTKLVQRFVADNPPPALVARAADTFTKTEGDIRAVMSTILHSDEFKTSFGKKVKRPLEFVASALRALDATPTAADLKKVQLKGAITKPTNPARKKLPDEPIAKTLRALGQVPFLWQAPNGYPDSAGAWVNTNNLLTRWNFSLALATGRVLEFDATLDSSDVTTPDALVDTWSDRILHRALPAADRAKLIDYVTGDTSSQSTRTQNLVALLMASPHFQYR